MTHVSHTRRIPLAAGSLAVLLAAVLALTADVAHATILDHEGFEVTNKHAAAVASTAP